MLFFSIIYLFYFLKNVKCQSILEGKYMLELV
nr:MAG TPA: hypothetical protein [Caudoviricetes sp.]